MSERRRSLISYANSLVAEARSRSIPPLAEAVNSPLPPHMTPELIPSTGIWPPEQRSRDLVVGSIKMLLVGPSMFTQRYGSVPEHEAEVAAPTIEADAYAATLEYASGATLASDRERFEVLRAYAKMYVLRTQDFLESRGPPPAASGVAPPPAVSGALQRRGYSSATAPRSAASGTVQDPGDASATAPPPPVSGSVQHPGYTPAASE